MTDPAPAPDQAWNLRDVDTISPAQSQAWAAAVVYGGGPESIEYLGGNDRSLVGENDDGRLYAAKPGTDDWWILFDATLPEHRDAAHESARRQQIIYLELEFGDVS